MSGVVHLINDTKLGSVILFSASVTSSPAAAAAGTNQAHPDSKEPTHHHHHHYTHPSSSFTVVVKTDSVLLGAMYTRTVAHLQCAVSVSSPAVACEEKRSCGRFHT